MVARKPLVKERDAEIPIKSWVQDLLNCLGPLTSQADGLIKIGEAIAKEVASDDDPVKKGVEVVKDLADAAALVNDALHGNTTLGFVGGNQLRWTYSYTAAH